MTILKVLEYPNPVLEQKSLPVTDFDQNLQKLVADMYDTMDYAQGVGLAAPQIGILKQLLVIRFRGKILTLVNPEIIKSQGETTDEEGCLSCPGSLVYLKRADKISVKAKDIKGKEILITEKGFFSRIIQHEMDHLKGILIIKKNPEKIFEL